MGYKKKQPYVPIQEQIEIDIKNNKEMVKQNVDLIIKTVFDIHELLENEKKLKSDLEYQKIKYF